MATRTLKVRIRDKHAKMLCRMARGVNMAWNYLNAYARHEWKAKRRFVNYAGRVFAEVSEKWSTQTCSGM